MRRLVLMPLIFVMGCVDAPRQQAALAAQKAADEIKLARLLKGYTPGPAQSCLPHFRDYQTKGVGETVLYSVDRRVIYRNDAIGCTGVSLGDTLVTGNVGGELCRGHVGTTFDRINKNITGSCEFRDFVPYRKTQ